MKIAVTNHAVERYRLRVPSAAKLDDEAIRQVIREMIRTAFDNKTVRDHPGYPERRMVTFSVGQEKLYIALGPNETDYPGDWAVLGVLYDREVGQKNIGTTIGDVIPDELKKKLTETTLTSKKSRYLVRVGGGGSKEIYDVGDGEDLKKLLARRQPNPDDVEVFERRDMVIRTEYVIEPKK